MPTFPTYAKIHLAGYGEQRASALMRTEMESGPPKQAKILSRVMITRPAEIRLDTLANYQEFVTWFSVDINEGASWFDWTDPLTNTVKQARIVGGGLDSSMLGYKQGPWIIRTKIETWG